MGTIIAKVKYLLHNVPAPIQRALEHAAVAGTTAFVATAKPLLPQLLAVPSMSLTKAAFLACAAAGIAAAYNVLKGSAKTLAAKWSAIPVAAPTPPAQP